MTPSGATRRFGASVVDDVRPAMSVKAAGFRTCAVEGRGPPRRADVPTVPEVCAGFTKNVAYATRDGSGPLCSALIVRSFSSSLSFPSAVLLAALAGAPVADRDVALAAVGWTALPFCARLLVAGGRREIRSGPP